MTYEEYLALETSSELKHEYVNGVVYAMSGGTPEHARLATSMSYQLSRALAGRPCVVFSADGRVRIAATGRSTYPDLSVVCGRLERASDDPDAIANPVVLVEVLSDTTERSDRGDKFAHYRQIPSLQEYVLISQHTRRVEVFHRANEGWLMTEAVAGSSVTLSSIGVTIAVDDLYHDPLAS
jgi:Uma2 family endonuclease